MTVLIPAPSKSAGPKRQPRGEGSLTFADAPVRSADQGRWLHCHSPILGANEDIEVTLRRLEATRNSSEDYDTDFQAPSDEACSAAEALVNEAVAALGPDFPRGSVSADGGGGIRLTWRLGNREVRLVYPSDGPARGYIYHEAHDEGGGLSNASGSSLTHWLRWLRRGS